MKITVLIFFCGLTSFFGSLYSFAACNYHGKFTARWGNDSKVLNQISDIEIKRSLEGPQIIRKEGFPFKVKGNSLTVIKDSVKSLVLTDFHPTINSFERFFSFASSQALNESDECAVNLEIGSKTDKNFNKIESADLRLNCSSPYLDRTTWS